jgi:hypothetical protein
LGWRSGKAEAALFSTAGFGTGQVTEIQVSRERAAKAEAVEIEFERTTEDAFTLSDGNLNVSNANGAIQFRTLAGGRASYRIPVSSCLQWKSFVGDTLYLAYRHPQEIRAVRFTVP